MTPIQVQIIHQTWKSVVPIADQAATLFYDRLFEIAPDTKRLFAGTDMAEQRKKLLATLNIAVQNAGNVDDLLPVLENLGRSHVNYGVEDSHYNAVGAALLWTLGQGLQDAFTEEASAAWTELFIAGSSPMRQAASEISSRAA